MCIRDRFNDEGHLPALSLGLPNKDGSIQEFDMPYQIEAKSSNSITFLLQAGADLQIRRIYSLSQSSSSKDPYIIEHSTTFDNKSSSAKAFSTLYLNIGTMQPISDGRMQQSYLNSSFQDIRISAFTRQNLIEDSNNILDLTRRITPNFNHYVWNDIDTDTLAIIKQLWRCE